MTLKDTRVKLTGIVLVIVFLLISCSSSSEQDQQSVSTDFVLQPTDTPVSDLAEAVKAQQTQTAAPVATMYARVDGTVSALATRWAFTPTPIPTLTPTPPWSMPLATEVLAYEPTTVTETWTLLMLQTYSQNHRMESLYVGLCDDEENFFDIEVVGDTITSTWRSSAGIINKARTFRVFFIWPSEPNWPEGFDPSDFSDKPGEGVMEAYVNWLWAHKMLIEDLNTGDVHWVKWIDNIPWRPIDLEGWATDDIFVFSQFGNPWHGFLTAVNAREKTFLCTLGLEYW